MRDGLLGALLGITLGTFRLEAPVSSLSLAEARLFLPCGGDLFGLAWGVTRDAIDSLGSESDCWEVISVQNNAEATGDEKLRKAGEGRNGRRRIGY